MIVIKNGQQLQDMRMACKITAAARALAGEMVRPGVTTKEIDKAVHDFIVSQGAKPSFLGYHGYPGSACISVNDEVIHGIPSKKRILKEGDIVKIDVGAFIGGFHGDSARTIAVGKVSDEAKKLIEVTRNSFFAGVEAFKSGNRIGDIGNAIQTVVENGGFSVVKRYIGHGIGKNLHEDPEVPNFGIQGRGARLYSGMTLAIEPMVNAGTANVKVRGDGWTVVTLDGKLSAHYENTIAITDGEPEILTMAEDI